MLVDTPEVQSRPVIAKNVISLPQSSQEGDSVYMIVEWNGNPPGFYVHDGQQWLLSMYSNPLPEGT